MSFWTYILHCCDGVFYTGHTDHLENRVADHKAGRFEGFTKNYLPVELVWSQEFTTRDEAKAAEKQIKGWSRKKKLALIRGDWLDISRLARSKSDPSPSSGQAGERKVSVFSHLFAALHADAASAAPQEACGLLLGQGAQITSIQPAPNVHPTPETHFEIDPQVLIDAHRAARSGGLKIIGYYHSHPKGPPRPSATDQEMAAGDGYIWAIIGQGAIEFWRDTASGFVAVGYTHPAR